MYVVLGASGNTGHVVAKNLLAQQKKVRVVGRDASHLQALASKGAEIVAGDIADSGTLGKAFQGAESAYVMIPPQINSKDILGFQERVGDSIVAALKNSAIKNVVALSSIGADKASGTGPVVGLHNFEQKLSQLNSANVLFLRAGYFMENTLPQAAVIPMTGAVMGPVRADLKLPVIASQDIGAAAADALLRLGFKGKQTHELLGQRDISYAEITTILGRAIGKADLKYVQASDDQAKAGMLRSGMSENVALSILELAAALNSGHMHALEARTKENTTPTSYETFAADTFLPAYRQQAAA